jgi:UDP-N-acetylmuramyl pentapeptide synthase
VALELGENTAALHAQVGERAAKCGVDLVLAALVELATDADRARKTPAHD